jgi:phytanoyl-CoA hydroxylase
MEASLIYSPLMLMSLVETVPPAPAHLLADPPHDTPTNNVDLYLDTMKLTSNGTPIASSALGRLYSHTIDTPTEELKAFYVEHGYVYIKSLLPIDVVREMRRKSAFLYSPRGADDRTRDGCFSYRYFESVSPSGILKEGTAPEEGIYCGAPPVWYTGLSTSTACGDSDPHAEKFLELIIEAHKAEWYTQFSDHPALLEFTKRLMGWENVQLLQRQLLRSNVPGQECTAVGVPPRTIYPYLS